MVCGFPPVGQLGGVDHLVVGDAPVSQLLAKDPGQVAALGLGDVGDDKGGGVQLVSGAQGGDDGDAPGMGSLDEVQLTAHQVDGVHNVVVTYSEKFLPGRGLVTEAEGVKRAVRVDGRRPCRGRVRLGLADGVYGGQKLAVQVGGADHVLVNEGELAHPGPCQGLGGVAAHPAQAQYGHMGGLETVYGGVAQHQRGAGKGRVHGGSSLGWKTGGASRPARFGVDPLCGPGPAYRPTLLKASVVTAS